MFYIWQNAKLEQWQKNTVEVTNTPAYLYNNNFTSINTSMKHSLLQTFEIVIALHFLDTLSDIIIKAFTLLF